MKKINQKINHLQEPDFQLEDADSDFTEGITVEHLPDPIEKSYKYRCNICAKLLKRMSDLKRHEMTHTKEKPHQCRVCSKTFTHSWHVARHIKIHSGEKPFGCSECSLSFIDIYSLQKHKITHSGEKPYKCNLCFKAFYTNQQLRRHKRCSKSLSNTKKKNLTTNENKDRGLNEI